jgi:hypothetical protein
MRRLIVMACLGACKGVPSDEGRDASLQLEGARFVRGEWPAVEDGPSIVSASLSQRASAGQVRGALAGELDRSALAVAIGMESDRGYWILRAGVPLASAPSFPTFQAGFGLAPLLPSGPRNVAFRAVDGEGRFGPPVVRTIAIDALAPPKGRLVISLSWNNEADLDLHVTLPNGIVIYKRNPSEHEPPPPSAGPASGPVDGGRLDRDSNAGCVFDGQRSENVVWTEAPPRGHYQVRVDTFSLCGAPTAIWRLEAVLDGKRIGGAAATTTENDVRFDHNREAGVLALELDVP